MQGNLIGTDVTGTKPLGNGNGIQIDGGSSNNTIGGTAAGAGNTIAFSTGMGVDVDATAGTGNAIRLNSIFSNTGLGIDLGGDGVTLNDSAGHAGPNNDLNFPVITGITNVGGVTTVTGSLESTPSTTFAVDFYTLSSINASGYGEGRYVLGSTSVTTNVTGNADFIFQFATPVGGARFADGHGHRPWRQHVGILPRVRCRHPADRRHRLHEHHRQRRGRVPVQRPGINRPQRRPAHLQLVVWRRRYGHGAAADTHLHGPGI